MEPIHEDISKARTISTSFYNSDEYYQVAKEKIFLPSWQFIGHTGMLPEVSQCHPFTLLPGCLDEPLVLTRDQEGIHCLSNVCTHRGNIVVGESCRSPQLRCRYHGRLFQLNGKFRSMPEFREVQDFPSSADDLPALPVFTWGNLLFTSLGKQFPAEVFLGDMIERVGWLPLEEFVFRPERSKEYLVNASWALYCENFLEGFHIPFVHAGLNAAIDYGNYTTELYKYSSLQLGIGKDGESGFCFPEGHMDNGRNVAAYYFFVFPNMMFNFYPWGLSLNIIEPNGVGKTKIRFLTYLWKEEFFNKGAGANLETVELEDEEVVENVQRGVRSRLYQHGRYSVTREQGTHHFHRIITSLLT
jgi:choline monooxygenase